MGQGAFRPAGNRRRVELAHIAVRLQAEPPDQRGPHWRASGRTCCGYAPPLGHFHESVQVCHGARRLHARSSQQFRQPGMGVAAQFIKPSSQDPWRPGFARGMYANSRVTPYLHALVLHLPKQLHRSAYGGLQTPSCPANPSEAPHPRAVSLRRAPMVASILQTTRPPLADAPST